MHRMRQMAPEKEFIAADPEAECAFMKTITLPNVRDSLALDRYHITVPADIAARARGAIDRMVALGQVSDGRGPHRRRRAGRGRRRRDVTTAVTVPAGLRGRRASSSIRSGGVLAGAAYADAVARACECRIDWRAPDGRARAGRRRGRRAARRRSRASSAPSGRCSTCCSAPAASRPPTRAYVDAVAGTGCRVLHTRKTAPGLRALDIAAVLAGGGARHRADLSHEVMVKDNHWQAALRSGGSLAGRARRGAAARGDGALRRGRVAGAARAGLRGRRDAAAGGQPDAGDGARRWGAPGAGDCGRASRSRRRAGSRWRTCARTRRRARTSSRSGR